jgi:hypothetical protein
MNANGMAKHYDKLTGEERFRLIVAAEDRGDEAEIDRLVNAAARIHYSFPDCAPFFETANVLAMVTFAELTEEAAKCADAWEHWSDRGLEVDEELFEEVSEPSGDRLLDLYKAECYLLATKATAWKLFCERHGIPPYRVWQMLSGFERLDRELKLAEGRAFTLTGMLQWMNRIRAERKPGEPETTEANIGATVENCAKELERLHCTYLRTGWPGVG